MEPQGSLPYSQELATGIYRQREKSSPKLSPNFPKIYSNIILSSRLTSSQ